MSRHLVWSILPALTIWLGCLDLSAAEVRVFAASSLTDALQSVSDAYEKQNGDQIIFNFGASSTLARQIEEGAPAELFFSADEAKMDGLEAKNLLVKESRVNRLANSLVIVVPAQGAPTIRTPEDLAGPRIKRVALGNPRAVPIGIYARQYLDKLGLWEKVEPKIVATENVRAALAAVEAGNADASIVYKTDAAIVRNVKVAYEVPLEKGPKIRYPVALLKDARDATAARGFLNFLNAKEAGRIFAKHGFIVLDPTSAR